MNAELTTSEHMELEINWDRLKADTEYQIEVFLRVHR